MKKYLIIIILVSIQIIFAYGQTAPDLISCAGETFSNDEVTLYMSMGEAFNTEISNDNFTIHQGVLQSIDKAFINPNPDPVYDCSNYSGRFFYETCDDGQVFFFIRTDDGTILDPYYADWINFQHDADMKVHFDYIEEPNISACSIAEKAITITCIEEDLTDPVIYDCADHSGTIFFSNCQGQEFWFIETTDGEFFDPYYAQGISFNEQDGMKINFDYVNEAFPTPCDAATTAIRITCIEENTSVSSIALNQEKSFEIYPNPANNKFVIRSEFSLDPDVVFTIFNTVGQRVSQFKMDTNQGKEIAVDTYEDGVYLIEMKGKSFSNTKKLIIQN